MNGKLDSFFKPLHLKRESTNYVNFSTNSKKRLYAGSDEDFEASSDERNKTPSIMVTSEDEDVHPKTKRAKTTTKEKNSRRKSLPKAKTLSNSKAIPAKWDVETSNNLPPISSIPEMFRDIVLRTPELVDVAKHLNGKPLRVATMCSGTESPLLALGMISEWMKKEYNVALNIEHVFSCEIEPFKQAYIERNFKPPILFRDICELGNKEAYSMPCSSMFHTLTKFGRQYNSIRCKSGSPRKL